MYSICNAVFFTVVLANNKMVWNYVNVCHDYHIVGIVGMLPGLRRHLWMQEVGCFKTKTEAVTCIFDHVPVQFQGNACQ